MREKISSTISRCCLVFQKARLSLHVKKSHSWPIECVGVTIRCPLAWRRNAFSGKCFSQANGQGRTMLAPTKRFLTGLRRTVFARKSDAATHLVGIIGGGCSCTRNIFHLPTLNKQRRLPQGFHILCCWYIIESLVIGNVIRDSNILLWGIFASLLAVVVSEI